MQTCVLVWGRPQVTFHLWLLILSSSLHFLPTLSELVFSSRPENEIGVLGAPVSLHCAAYDSHLQRAVSVSWERASEELTTEDIHQMGNGSLFFPRLRESDLGRYICRATSGQDHIMTTVQVEQADLEGVFHSPQSQEVSEGQSVSLQCVSGDSSPPAFITWLRHGTPLTKGNQIQGQYGGGSQRKTSGSLHLFNVSLEDQGEYICVTHNPQLNSSRYSDVAMLTVQGVPRRLRITQGPDNITVAVAREASMSCVVRGFPVPTVLWFRDHRPLDNSSSFSLLENGQRLVFRNVSVEDEGSYHCEASNQRETVRSQSAMLLPAVMDWAFVQQPSNQTVRRGGSVSLVCRPPHSRPTAQLVWFKNNTRLPPRPHYTQGPKGDLIFHRVQETDGGTYFCRASNPYLHRAVTSSRVSLDVLAPPSVRLSPLVAIVSVGAQVVFRCEARGHPTPSIRWHKQGLYRETGGRTTVGMRNASLTIQSVRSYDEGMYTCEAFNAVGRDQSTATLRVTASPIIVSMPGQVRAWLGSMVVLPCRAVGVLPISYTWSRGEPHTPIPSSPQRHTDDDGSLHITSVRWSDAGEYQCTAGNRVGQQQRRTILTVTAEDGPADRDEQIRHVLSAVNNTETEQATTMSNSSNGVERNSGMAHKPISSQYKPTTVHAPHEDSTTLSTPPLSTPGKSLSLKSHSGTTSVVREPHTWLQLDPPAAHSTQPTVMQIQTDVLQLQPSVLHQSPDHLAQSLMSNNLPPETHRQTLVTHRQPPLTSNQLLATQVQSLNYTQPKKTHYTPSITGVHHHVLDERTQPSFPIPAISQSWALSLPASAVPSTQHPDILHQSPTILPNPTQPLTQSLSEALPQDPLSQPTALPQDLLPQSTALPQDPLLQPTALPQDPLLQPTALPQDPLLQPTDTLLTDSLSQLKATSTQPLAFAAQPQPSRGLPQTSHTQSQPSLANPQPPPTQSQPSPAKPHPSPTHSQPSLAKPQPPPTQSQPSFAKPQPSPTQSQPSVAKPHPPPTQSQPSVAKPHPPPTQSQPSVAKPHPPPTQSQPSVAKPHPPPTQSQMPQIFTQPPLSQPQPQPHQTQTSHGPTWHHPVQTQPARSLTEASIATTHSHDLTPRTPTTDPQVHSGPRAPTSDPLQQNASQSANPAHPVESAGPNDSESTEGLKGNTSQSTMRTSDNSRVTPRPPSWLPVLEKHDIPIVVGVGVSLAFIFITMGFYSLVPKNEPAPIGRGVPRNLAVPCRHAERLATGKTYENRAFEDDDLMAVIEQSPNTSDTRARPPVTVQIEPTLVELQQEPPPQPTPEHSVIAETYLEPSQDTQIDPSLDEEKGGSLSHPSIQLQCVEDWAGSGAEYGSFQDALPPPTPTAFRSPSPSPPSLREEGLRSSLTLQTAEPCATPVHHSLSISHGNMPLLLSHCVSLGLTTVAVDVHFFPAASAASSSTTAQLNSTAPPSAVPQGPALSSRLAHSQETDLFAASMRQSK